MFLAGNKFDLRKFHTLVLKNRVVSLVILEDIVEFYISETFGENIIRNSLPITNQRYKKEFEIIKKKE